MLIIILGTGIYFAIFSNLFWLKNIETSGNQKVLTQDINNLIEKEIDRQILFFKSKSIILLNSEKIENDLAKKFPQIESIEIKKKLPNGLIIKVLERTSVAVWCNNESCFSVDKTGIIFEEYRGLDQTIIKFQSSPNETSLGGKIIENDILNDILKTQEKLKSLGVNISEFSVLENSRINVKTKKGWEVYLNTAEDFDWQLAKLSLVLQQEIPLNKQGDLEYIDLRFTKIYYKYKQ